MSARLVAMAEAALMHGDVRPAQELEHGRGLRSGELVERRGKIAPRLEPTRDAIVALVASVNAAESVASMLARMLARYRAVTRSGCSTARSR